MKDFRQFSKQARPENMAEEEAKNYEEQTRDFVNSRKNSSQSDLERELFSKIAKSKQDGTFDKKQIEKLASSVEPFMNAEQRANLHRVLKMLE